MNLAPYRFTFTPRPGGYPTIVCIQWGVESMSFVTYMFGPFSAQRAYEDMLEQVVGLSRGNKFVDWCDYHELIAYSCRRSTYQAVMELKEDMIRMDLLPCPDMSA